MPTTTPVENVIFSPIQFPSGPVASNRLVKVSMYEHLASFFGGSPNEHHYNLYRNWAKHGWGIIVTGNVQVSKSHLTLGRDLVVPRELTELTVAPFKKLAAIIHGEYSPNCVRSLAVMQLNHSGRQSANIIGGRFPFRPPLAPSAIPVSRHSESLVTNEINRLLFQVPRAMTLTDIDKIVKDFVAGACLAFESGFDGIQLHVAHGYLLASFISPKSNARTDEYSASEENALRLLKRVVTSIRETVPENFLLGIKFNVSDYIDRDNLFHQKEVEKRALKHIKAIAGWGSIDFIEVSGGDYEKPDFLASTPLRPRQAFFARLSHQALKALSSEGNPRSPLILLTGGLRTPALLHTALTANHAHLLGVGRGSVICPDMPQRLKQLDDNSCARDDNPLGRDPDISLLSSSLWTALFSKVSLVGAGVSMAWYLIMMRHISAADLPNTLQVKQRAGVSVYYSVGGIEAVLRMWVWIVPSASFGRILNTRTAILVTVTAVLSFLVLWMNGTRMAAYQS